LLNRFQPSSIIVRMRDKVGSQCSANGKQKGNAGNPEQVHDKDTDNPNDSQQAHAF
jgi:hypothetical protein